MWYVGLLDTALHGLDELRLLSVAMRWVRRVCFTPVVLIGIELSRLTASSVELLIKIVELWSSNCLMGLYSLIHYQIVVLRAVLEIWQLQLPLILDAQFLKLILKLEETLVLWALDQAKLLIESLLLAVIKNFISIAIFVRLVILLA